MEDINCGRAYLALVNIDSRQGRRGVAGLGHVVEADQGDVIGDANMGFAEGIQRT